MGTPAGALRRRPRRLRWGALTLALVAFGLVLPGRLAATASGAPPGSGAGTTTLLVADLTGLTHDEQIVFTVLQGIVNRTSARVYYLGLLGGQDYLTDPTAELWLRDAVNLSTLRVPDPYELLLRFRNAVHGLVVWDPALKVDTQNVATTMGGLEDVLPVSPDSAKVLSAPPYSFPIVEDLRNEHLGSRAAAYEWALRNFPPEREHYGLLAWLGGTRNFVPVGQHGLRDFIVARRGFAFEAEPINEAPLVERILGAFPPGMSVYGYPFVDDVVYSTTAATAGTTGIVQAPGEPVGVTEISASGKQLVPSTDSANLTVHGSFPALPQSPPWDDAPRPPQAGTTYVSFVITDGDNLGWDQQRLRVYHWDDPLRGTIPVGVSISPLLASHAPRIYDYYLRTATQNEVFISGPSGAGYTYPGYQSDLDGYLGRTKPLLDLAGLRAVWILDYGYVASPSPATTARYVEKLNPSAIFADYGGWILPNPPEVAFSGETPVLHAAWGENVNNTVSRIRGSSFQQLQHQPYAFVFVALVTSSMGFKQAHAVMDQLAQPYFGASRPYEVVRPDHLIGLIRGARLAGTQFPPG